MKVVIHARNAKCNTIEVTQSSTILIFPFVINLDRCIADLYLVVGRTGRVFEGKCLKMYTRKFYRTLKEYDLPEIQSAPLDRLVLRVKQIGKNHVI